MGLFIYANSTHGVEIEDRTLAHLKIVIFAKLRRDEPFGFSWDNDIESGSGRGAVWLSSGVALQFAFYGNKMPNLNRAWIEQLTISANSATGLCIIPEPTNA